MADNVTIDLNDFDISGSRVQVGITVRDFDHFKLRGRGGVIRNFLNAVQLYDSNNSLVEGVVFYNNDLSIYIQANYQSVNYSFINNNDFLFDRFTSVSISNSNRRFDTEVTGIIVWNNEFYFSGRGIELCRAKDSLIMENLVWGSETDGIQVRKSKFVDVYNNHVYDFEGRGITLDLTSYSEVKGNKVEYGDIGIQVDEATRFVSDACGGDSSIETNALNNISDNSLFNNDTGIVLGKDWTPNRTTANFNLIERNKIYNSRLGILFNLNTKQNVATNNAFQGTTTRVEDHGVRNRY